MDTDKSLGQIMEMEKSVVDHAYELFHFVHNKEDMQWEKDYPDEAKRIQTAAHHMIEDCAIVQLTVQNIQAERKAWDTNSH